MSKGWTTIETIYSLKNKPETKAEKWQKTRRYESLMAKTETLPAVEIKKRSVISFNEQKEKENNLLKAFDEKKLKSEKAIKQAIRIKKERAKKQNSAKQDTEKVSKTTETTESTV